MTIPSAAHTGDQAIALQHRAPVIARVLTALIGMHDHFTLGLATPARHDQCIHRQLSVDAITHRPANDVTGEQVHHHRQVGHPLPQDHVAQVRHPHLVRAGHRESRQEVLHPLRGKTPREGGPGGGPLAGKEQALLAHQGAHPLLPHLEAFPPQEGGEAPVAVPGPGRRQGPQAFPEGPLLGRGVLGPVVEGAPGHPEDPGKEADGVGSPVASPSGEHLEGLHQLPPFLCR